MHDFLMVAVVFVIVIAVIFEVYFKIQNTKAEWSSIERSLGNNPNKD